MGKFDHLSSDRFWDLVYETAKNKKKNKATWRALMSAEYADSVRYMAETHMTRLENMQMYDGVELTAGQKGAYKFIRGIRGQAMHALEKSISEERNIRRYNDLTDLHEYVSYLKDSIEDLRAYVDDPDIVFEFYATVEDMKSDVETPLDEWIRRRARRRGEDIDIN